MINDRAGMHGRFKRTSAALPLVVAACLSGFNLLMPGQALAAVFNMPNGGTSWIEVSSNSCDLGTPATGADCFGATSLLPAAEYSLEPPASINASGQVLADRIELSNTGFNIGGGFVWGATGGLFTLHGSGNTPVMVTATLLFDAQVVKGTPLSFGSVSAKIGNWAFDQVSSDLNFRVGSAASDSVSCSFNSCGGLNLQDRLVTHTVNVMPGQSFNLGFQLTTSTLSSGPVAGPVTVSAQATLGLDAGAGYFITGNNGYDSRVSPVPEPGVWAMMLAGVGLLGWRRRSDRRS